MKVLIVHNEHKYRGGEETFVNLQKMTHEKMGDEVYLYSKDNKNISKISIGLILNSLFSVRTYFQLQKIATDYKPDIVFVHNVFPLISVSAYFALSKLKIPIIQLIHNYHYVQNNDKSGKTIIKKYLSLLRQITKVFIFRNSNFIFAFPSQYLKNKYKNTFLQQKKIVLTPAINLADTPIQNMNLSSKKSSYNLYLGRFSEEKGIWDVLAAAKKLHKESFLLVGDGEMLEEIRNYINKYDLSNVKISTFQEGKDKWKSISNAKLVIIPSKWQEPFGLTLIEAILAQTPILATKSGGMKKTLGHTSSCFTYKAGSIQQLANKIDFINQNYESILQSAQREKEKAVNQFSTNNYQKQILASLNRR